MKRLKDWATLKGKGRKGFTLIELIVVMAVLAILVLLAAPKFLGHTKEAQFTKHINNAKVLEDASERYYIDHGQWPRGADADKYTPAEVSAYAERIYDITGSELELAEGNYWDIDYAALGSYANLPDEDER